MEYATLNKRVKAAVYDSFILIIFMYCCTEVFTVIGGVSNPIKIITFIILFFLYEPILVSIFGATIGHFFNDIVVKKETNPTKNIYFHIAIIRFLVKLTLGWLSLLTVTGTKKHQAIHDKVVNSIVIPFKKNSNLKNTPDTEEA